MDNDDVHIYEDVNLTNTSEYMNTDLTTAEYDSDLFDEDWYASVQYILDRHITHYICLFGIIGNFINLAVLTRKSMTAHMQRMEKSSHVGLIALALSDDFYCVCSFPQAWNDSAFSTNSIDFWLVYNTYGMACINCFLLSSTWLTMALAVCRYLAICHPLYARQYLGITASRTIIIAVFCLSILFNLPRFWMKEIINIECVDGSRSYFNMPGYMASTEVAGMAYMWLYFIFVILLPLVVLAYCNIYLVKALHKSSRLRRQLSSSNCSDMQHSEATRVVTLTLCIIVIMYIVLVGPAELVAFWKPFVGDNTLQYGLAVKMCNCLQKLNFAVNFILYCVINVHFRKEIKHLLLCQHFRLFIAARKQKQRGESHSDSIKRKQQNGEERSYGFGRKQQHSGERKPGAASNQQFDKERIYGVEQEAILTL